MRFTLVRSPRVLVGQHQVGYGWGSVNFSKYASDTQLLTEGFAGKNIGRSRNQVRRYFNLEKDDIVVVPLTGTVAFAVVEGSKSHVRDSSVKYGENRIAVNYLTDESGGVYYVPRKDLSTALESRLKIRMSIASLDSFEGELSKIVDGLKSNEIYTVSKEISEKKEQVAVRFKELLLERLRTGSNIWLDAGGYGLEKLVQEIFEANGYKATIEAKNKVKGVADVDVIATKANPLTGDVEATLVQVKHHKGVTSKKGATQLVLYPVSSDQYAYYRKVLISTAVVEEGVRKVAEGEDIMIIDGEELVDWIYENVDKLSEATLRKLGVVLEPSLI